MLQRVNKIITDTRVAVDMLIDEHDRKKEHKTNLNVERKQLADLISAKGVMRQEYLEQRRRFIGRFFLVGYVDIDMENKEYNQAITQAELYDKQGDKSAYDESMDVADSLYDEMLAITNSKAQTIADIIIGNRNENIRSYVVFNAGSRENLDKHEASFSKTAIALKDELAERGTNASLGSGIRSILPFNDNHMHGIMSGVDHIQAGPPEKSNFAAIAVVDPNEPKNPFIPTELQRSITKELTDGGVVQLQSNRNFYQPPIWTPIN